jgi:hypothetical protein
MTKIIVLIGGCIAFTLFTGAAYYEESAGTPHLALRFFACGIVAVVVRLRVLIPGIRANHTWDVSVIVLICLLVAVGWVAEASIFAAIVGAVPIARRAIPDIESFGACKAIYVIALATPLGNMLKLPTKSEDLFGFIMLFLLFYGQRRRAAAANLPM